MPSLPGAPLVLSEEVAAALAGRAPVVALESTIISHGLPRPRNLEVARAIEAAVRAEGAVPATIGVVDGVARVGLDEAALERIAGEGVAKASTRDLGTVIAQRRDAATTVASTAWLAVRAGISVFATGGLGGVHREARESWDESADLVALARAPLAVVCSGVKSILDVAATLERLETLGVPVVGFRTQRFPGFYLGDSGHPVDARVDSPEEIASILLARRGLAQPEALVVARPLPPEEQLDPELHERVLTEALAAARAAGARGKHVTPFLLAWFHHATGGASLEANVNIIVGNARLAAQVAVAVAAQGAS